MSSPSIQLDLEKALKAFITAQNIFAAPARDIHAAHELDKVPDGTFLLIICEQPPDWETMVINAIIPARFELATAVKNPDSRSASAIRHGTDFGKLIELFSDQNYAAVITALNAPAAPPDNRSWKGLGFT